MKLWHRTGKSWGARKLAAMLEIKMVKEPPPHELTINWGNSGNSFLINVINSPVSVAKAVNKLTTFQTIPQHLCPTYTTSKEVARTYEKVMCRTLLKSYGGRGIVVGEVVDAPLYTEYFKHDKEYRVHVFNGSVIEVAEKKRKIGSTVNQHIRNHDNGWVYVREGVECPQKCLAGAIEAVSSLGLVFGAVDIGYSSHRDTFVVFEVNTAPGLHMSTVVTYAKAIKEYLYDF